MKITNVNRSKTLASAYMHCIKYVNLQTFFWSVLFRILTECRHLQRKYLHSLHEQEIWIQKKSVNLQFMLWQWLYNLVEENILYFYIYLILSFFRYSCYKSHSSSPSWTLPSVTGGLAFSQLVHPQKLVHDLFDLLKTHRPKYLYTCIDIYLYFYDHANEMHTHKHTHTKIIVRFKDILRKW